MSIPLITVINGLQGYCDDMQINILLIIYFFFFYSSGTDVIAA